MSFEEEFPNLKGKECCVDEFKVGEIPTRMVLGRDGRSFEENLAQEPNEFRGKTYNFLESDKVYQEKDIQKHCLDKQEVKKIIDKICSKGSGVGIESLKRDLKKELRLK